ncbi:hypothetical protein C6497_03920 [Candidatus Poribacteria bacterium]|nr:MAG: hypothetical protein C6497_03920 [Candidatus Poribacteria bacterium]
MKHLIQIFTSLIIIFSSFNSFADVSPLSLAEHYTNLKNYDAAITEYKRFLFFHPDDDKVPEIYLRIGTLHRNLGLLPEAIDAIRQAVIRTSDKEQKSEHQIDLAVVLIANKDYDLARLELIKVLIRNPSETLYKRALLLQGVTYVYQFRWEEAQDIFNSYSQDEKLDELLQNAENLPYKSKLSAKILSGILPGSGQFYAGNWKSGLNALALNSALGYITIDSILDQYYVDAIMWTYFIFQRYYQGNLYRAGKAVEEYNDEMNRSIADRILLRLQEITNK